MIPPKRLLPVIIILTLTRIEFFKENFAQAVELLSERYTVRHVTCINEFVQLVRTQIFKVFLAEPWIATCGYATQMHAELEQYVRQGGRVIYSFMFARYISKWEMDEVWRRWGTGWRWAGDGAGTAKVRPER